jgi:nitrite reductase/ring-hydroxylating ferredoxin subunit
MNAQELVDTARGLVSRKIFVDQDVYEEELARIFGRCWLYLGHETQLPEAGDYFTTYMAEDPVVVTRDAHGEIRAFLNSCRHRGMRVCRSEAGNSSFFRCTYHGWTYSNDGKLAGVPRYRTGYREQLDRDQWGLVEVGQLRNYKGMLWATWDPEAPPFETYLGGMKLYLDLMIDRLEGGLEAVGGTQKWILDANWKLGADNFIGDMYHVPISHGSTQVLGIRNAWGDDGYQINPGNGHGFGGEFGGVGEGEQAATAYTPFVKAMRERLAQEHGDFVNKIVPIGHLTIFPSFSALDALRHRTFRVWHPRGPRRMELYSWCMVDKALPDELKQAVRQQYIFKQGPAGVIEQEDGENWTQCTSSSVGWRARQLEFNYQMGMGYEQSTSEQLGGPLPGQMGGMWSEINQRGFYQRWLELMTSDGWSSSAQEAAAPHPAVHA